HQRGAADDGRCVAPAIDDLDGGLAVRIGAAAHESRRFNSETDVDKSAGAHGIQQDFFDELLRGHHGLARTDRRPRSLEALRLDLAELLAGGAGQKTDRALPTGGRVDAAQALVDSRSP